MAKIYYNLINKGLKSIEDVPLVWKKEVEEMLEVDKVTM